MAVFGAGGMEACPSELILIVDKGSHGSFRAWWIRSVPFRTDFGAFSRGLDSKKPSFALPECQTCRGGAGIGRFVWVDDLLRHGAPTRPNRNGFC
jgi:hypothetical protein